MTEEMERVGHALSGQLLQLANLATQAAELTVQLAARRAAAAEQRSRDAAVATGRRLQADRELAAAVWARSRSRRWLAAAEPDELVTVWANARAWAPHDRRAARAVEVLAGRIADRGVDVERAVAALDAGDAAALHRALTDPSPGAGAEAPAGAGAQRTGPSAAADTDRQAEVLEVLRAEWDEDTVDAVTSGDAFGALAHKLSRLGEDGHDLHAVVRSLPADKIVDAEIRQPAAFAAWLVDRYAAADAVQVAGAGFNEPGGEAVARAGRGPRSEPGRTPRTPDKRTRSTGREP